MSKHFTSTLAIRGVAFNWLGRGASLIIVLFMTPFLVRTLGAESYGLWAIVMAFTNYYAMADLGLRSAATKYIAQFLALNDSQSVSKIIATSIATYSAAGGVLLILVGAFSWVFPQLFSSSHYSEETLRLIVFLTGLNVVIGLPAQVFGAIIVAHTRFDITAAISVGAQLAQALLVVAALLLGSGLVGMAIATLFVGTTGHIVRVILALRLMGGISLSRKDCDRDTFTMIFRFGGLTFATRLAQRIRTELPKLIIGMTLGPSSVAFFEIANLLTSKVRGIASGMRNVVFPLASGLDAGGRDADLARVLIMGPRILLGISLICAAIFVVMGRDLIGLWIDQQFVAESYPVLCILTVALIAGMPAAPLAGILRGTGRLKALAVLAYCNLLIAAVGGPLVVPVFGLKGIAAVVAISTVLIRGILLPLIACRALGYDLVDFWQRVGIRAVLSALPAWSVAVVFQAYVPPSNLLYLVLQIVSVLGVGAVGLVLIGLDRKNRATVFSALGLEHVPRVLL